MPKGIFKEQELNKMTSFLYLSKKFIIAHK